MQSKIKMNSKEETVFHYINKAKEISQRKLEKTTIQNLTKKEIRIAIQNLYTIGLIRINNNLKLEIA